MLFKSASSSPSCRNISTPLILLLFVSLFVHPASAENIKAIRPTGYVTDLAGVIEPATRLRLENLCTELEQKTGAQIAIVTVHSLEGESVEQYAVDLYKQFGVGGKNDNRGVLLLLSPDDHKYRIEVGYGLEPVINDARAGDVGRAMVPFLRQGDYNNAVFTATWQLANYVAADRGATLSGAAPARPADTGRGDTSNSFPIWWVLLILFIVFRILGAAFRHTPGRRGGGGGWWIWPIIGGLGGGGFGGSSGGWSGGGGFGGFGGGSSGGGGASGSW